MEPANCLLCEPSLTAGATVCVMLETGTVRLVGAELQDAFYRLIWRDYGVTPATIETLAQGDILHQIRLPHPCGEFNVFLITCL